MLDPPVRRLIAPPLESIARRLAAVGIAPVPITVVGWLSGVAACVLAGTGHWTWALVGWLLNRLLDGLDGPVARLRGATERGGFLDLVADFSIYGGFVVAVGIERPEARLACLVLFLAYYLSGTAFLALSSVLERLGRPELADGRSLRFVGGLAEGTETVIAYVAFCLFPEHAETIAWVFAVVVGITAVQRVVFGVRVLALSSTDLQETP